MHCLFCFSSDFFTFFLSFVNDSLLPGNIDDELISFQSFDISDSFILSQERVQLVLDLRELANQLLSEGLLGSFLRPVELFKQDLFENFDLVGLDSLDLRKLPDGFAEASVSLKWLRWIWLSTDFECHERAITTS